MSKIDLRLPNPEKKNLVFFNINKIDTDYGNKYKKSNL